ncbi:hypothetical protein N7519_007228 [Penicillium mononematosum]|uniref:uncharacterized protein n=1 Tax=Penicillium mononematosum TaxID=268346 RepID=UPI0025491978|nr:uncharacterized protein N7519_007228 [Penicillium mononematosum]KAJ6185927.1 hypothetical protein N7519_007228 [Penicillium mononematosum]
MIGVGLHLGSNLLGRPQSPGVCLAVHIDVEIVRLQDMVITSLPEHSQCRHVRNGIFRKIQVSLEDPRRLESNERLHLHTMENTAIHTAQQIVKTGYGHLDDDPLG